MNINEKLNHDKFSVSGTIQEKSTWRQLTRCTYKYYEIISVLFSAGEIGSRLQVCFQNYITITYACNKLICIFNFNECKYFKIKFVGVHC